MEKVQAFSVLSSKSIPEGRRVRPFTSGISSPRRGLQCWLLAIVSCFAKKSFFADCSVYCIDNAPFTAAVGDMASPCFWVGAGRTLPEKQKNSPGSSSTVVEQQQLHQLSGATDFGGKY